jgi:hypothetical protein
MGPPCSGVPAVLLCVTADRSCQSWMMATLLDIAVRNTARIQFQNHCLREDLAHCCEHSNQYLLNGVSRGGGPLSRKAISGALMVKVRIRNKLCLWPASCWFLAWPILRPWRLRLYVPLKRRLNFNGLHRTELRGFSPPANYTDRATAACWRSANFSG